MSDHEKGTEKKKTAKEKNEIESKKNDDSLFTTHVDFLIFRLLNIFTVNDKPWFFMVPILFVSVGNIFLNYFSHIYFSLVLFFVYEYLCGNSLLGMGRDGIIHGIVFCLFKLIFRK